MKVVMTVSNPFKPDPRVYKEAKSLARAGHNIYVIAWDREGKYPKSETIDGINVLRIGPKASYGYRMVVGLPVFYLNALRIILRLKPDVVHTHDFDTALFGFLLKLTKRTKWVYDIHDLYETFVSSGFVRKLVSSLDKKFSMFSDFLIVVNYEFINLLRKWGRIENIYVVMNTIPPQTSVPKKRKTFTVFYGGVLSPGRFILEMIEICNELGIPLKIAGFGLLEKEVQRKCSYPCKFLGVLPQKKALEEMGKSHLTFMLYDPSNKNNLLATPNKLFEAMAMKTALLVIEGSIASKIVSEGKCGLSCKYERGDVKLKLLRLFESPKLVKKMGHLGQKFFLAKYTWEISEKELLKIYGRGDVL